MLLPCLGVDSYAADDNLIDSQNFNEWTIIANDTYSISYSSSSGNNIGLPRGSSSSTVVFEYMFFLEEDFRLNHEYKFKFEYMSTNMNTYSVSARLFVFNGPYLERSVSISNISTPTSGNWTSYDLNFVPSDLLGSVGSGYQLAIGFYFTATNINSTATNRAYIRNIYLSDLDNDGIISQISNGIAYLHLMIDEAFCKIVGGTTISGVTYPGYFNELSGWLSNVKDGIVSKLQDVKSGITSALDTVKTGIQNTLNTVKTAITDKLEAIKNSINQTFTNVIDGLKSYLRSLFIPSDGYFAGKVNELKLWAEQHLGFLYTGASMFANFIQEISDMFVSDSFQFTLPDIDFTVAGEHIQLELSDSVSSIDTVLNDSVFAGLYTLYKTLLSMLIGFALFKYSESTLNKILSN